MTSPRYRKGTRVILFLGFGGLLALIVLLGLESFRRTDEIFGELSSIQEGYRRQSTLLHEVQSDLSQSAIFIRDYLLVHDDSAAADFRQQLLELRAAMQANAADLDRLSDPRDDALIGRLRASIAEYWDVLSPAFSWTLQKRSVDGPKFLQEVVRGRRRALLSMILDIDGLLAASLTEEQQRVSESRTSYRTYLVWMLASVFYMAVFTASVSVWRIIKLEQRAAEHIVRTEAAERELRRLSQKLVEAQEEERRALSRELHDEVGQVLIAIRMVFGNLERAMSGSREAFERQLAEGRLMTEQTLQSVRDISLGLRPSMLDDLGLEPAIQWQVREFSRRSGIAAFFDCDGALDGLTDRVRTCVYRVLQESLTNCARHSRATKVLINLRGGQDGILLTVRDDGVGFRQARHQPRGLGLLGIEERVRELGGSVRVDSEPGKGTVVEANIPVRQEVAQ